MKGSLSVRLNGVKSFQPEISVFAGGEVNVCIPDRKGYPPSISTIVIEAQIQDSEMLIALLLLVDALRRRFTDTYELGLLLPYVPYARQDRVCNKGESLTSKVFCSMINSCEFDRVVILDPHSEVVSALLNNVAVVEQADTLLHSEDLSFALHHSGLTLVAPDYGSTKKVEKVAQRFGHTEVIQGTKHRDLKTGALSGFGFYGNVEGKDLLIIDDICDGGGTFVGLAKELKAAGCGKISLYVTHGIFSRGVENLLDNGIDTVYTTDSLIQTEHSGLKVISVFN